MRISSIKIRKITPSEGHIGFVSFIVDEWLFLNNIAIFTRLQNKEQIRLVFPEKKVGEKTINLFHPLDANSYFELEGMILDKLQQL